MTPTVTVPRDIQQALDEAVIALAKWTESLDAAIPETIKPVLLAVAHLREIADFNRSWTDGRRGDGLTIEPVYIQRRTAWANYYDAWAEAVLSLLAAAPAPEPEADAIALAVNAALDRAAHAVADHQREGREWVRDSLWDDITRQAAARVRALKIPASPAEGDA